MGSILRVAPPEMASQPCIRRQSVAAVLLYHSSSTFYPSLKQIGQKIAKLLNERQFEGVAAGNSAVTPGTAP